MSDTKTIQQKIEEFIAPMRVYIQNDGGDVSFKKFDEATGILTLEVLGHCIGCASYDTTYTFGLKEWIMANFSEVKDVLFEPRKVL